MENYAGLAGIYDLMMMGVDYEAWADYVLDAAATFGVKPRCVLDLACGTGSTTIPLAKRGLTVTGLDLSPAMLAIAREKAQKAGVAAAFAEKNMLALDYENRFEMIVSFQDGINYLTGPGDFEKLAAGVASALKEEGVFIFDLNRVDHYSDSETTVIDLDDPYLVYENQYHQESRIWRIKLTGFVKEGELYRRFEEIHEEKNHAMEDVEAALLGQGLNIAAVWRIFTKEAAAEKANRVLVVAKKGSNHAHRTV